MSNELVVAIISAATLLTVPAVTTFFTKRAERRSAWRDKRLAYYEELLAAANGIVGPMPPDDARMRFAGAVNKMHLVASEASITALHAFCDEIAISNNDRSSSNHDRLWSDSVYQIPVDLADPPTAHAEQFSAHLWASGIGSNVRSDDIKTQ